MMAYQAIVLPLNYETIGSQGRTRTYNHLINSQTLYQLNYKQIKLVGRARFELAMLLALDLQSNGFNHSPTYPNSHLPYLWGCLNATTAFKTLFFLLTNLKGNIQIIEIFNIVLATHRNKGYVINLYDIFYQREFTMSSIYLYFLKFFVSFVQTIVL